MHPGFISDRKALGYKVLKDTSCGIKLVVIIDSTVPSLLKPIKCNQQFVKEVYYKVNRKSKRVFVVVSFAVMIWFSNPKEAKSIGVSMQPIATPVEIVQSTYQHHPYKMNIAPTVSPKLDKITFWREVPVGIYMMDERFLKTSEVQKLINKIRGGGPIESVLACVVIVFIWQIARFGEGFVPNNPNPGWGLHRPNNQFQPNGSNLRYPPIADLFFPSKSTASTGSGSILEIDRPTSMPHQEFTDLTKEQRRALPHTNDMKIIEEGRPELEVGFWQSKFKVDDHGAIHGCDYDVKENGTTKTEKTDDNVLKMMKSVVDMPNRDNIQWFEDGTYQGGTDREFEAIHIYDPNKRVIAVFKKSTGKFVTTCQLDGDEHEELLKTGNFGGKAGWFSGKPRNLPPQQTAVNSFETDVMGISPVSPINENSSPGFTPTRSFESDVMGITPVDKSQWNNP